MEAADMHTDGNAIAGLLQEVFVAEFTSMERTCQSCGDQNPAGAHRRAPVKPGHDDITRRRRSASRGIRSECDAAFGAGSLGECGAREADERGQPNRQGMTQRLQGHGAPPGQEDEAA